MKKYFVDQVLLIVDGENSDTFTITGFEYNPNKVKENAKSRARELYPNKTITCTILTHRDLNFEEYSEVIKQNPDSKI